MSGPSTKDLPSLIAWAIRYLLEMGEKPKPPTTFSASLLLAGLEAKPLDDSVN